MSNYSYNRFLRPISYTDRSIQVIDDSGKLTHTINPFTVINLMANSNILKINLKSNKFILIPFSTQNESKLAISVFQSQLDTLKAKTPLFIDKQIENYISATNSGAGTSGTSGLTGATGSAGTSGTSGVSATSNKSFVTLTDSNVITWDFSTGYNAVVTLGGNRSLEIINAEDGDSGLLIINQDTIGSRTLGLTSSSLVLNGGSGAISLTSASSSVDILAFVKRNNTFIFSISNNAN